MGRCVLFYLRVDLLLRERESDIAVLRFQTEEVAYALLCYCCHLVVLTLLRTFSSSMTRYMDGVHKI